MITKAVDAQHIAGPQKLDHMVEQGGILSRNSQGDRRPRNGHRLTEDVLNSFIDKAHVADMSDGRRLHCRALVDQCRGNRRWHVVNHVDHAFTSLKSMPQSIDHMSLLGAPATL